MAKKITVLFDLDGTLIDSNEIIIKSYFEAFKVFKPNLTLTRNQVISFIGPTLEDVFSNYVDKKDIPKMIQTYRDYYTQNEKKYHQLYPGVLEGIKALKAFGATLGIVTSKFKEAAWPSFTFYKLDPYFDSFIALEDVNHPKPHQEPVLKGLSECGPYDYAIMIGDNQGDILSGLNAGIDGAGVAWSIKGKNHLRQVNPTIVFDTMDDIVAYIRQKMEA